MTFDFSNLSAGDIAILGVLATIVAAFASAAGSLAAAWVSGSQSRRQAREAALREYRLALAQPLMAALHSRINSAEDLVMRGFPYPNHTDLRADYSPDTPMSRTQFQFSAPMPIREYAMRVAVLDKRLDEHLSTTHDGCPECYAHIQLLYASCAALHRMLEEFVMRSKVPRVPNLHKYDDKLFRHYVGTAAPHYKDK